MTRVVATVLVHDNPFGAREVVRRLTSQSIRPASILVVDNGSPNPLDLEGLEFEDVHLLRSDLNMGVGAGHNLAIRAALASHSPDAIWILEHDTFPDRECLERLLEARSSRPGVKVVVAEETRNNYESSLSRSTDAVGGPLLERFTLNGPLVDREVFERVGFFEEKFFVGQEDWEFSSRVRSFDIPIVPCPAGRVLHENRRTGRKFHGFVSPARLYYSSRNITWRNPPSGRLMRWLGYIEAAAKAVGEVVLRRRGTAFARARWWAYSDAVNNRMGRGPRRFH